jgi:uncharacterized protein YdiU (UPF0061 family)
MNSDLQTHDAVRADTEAQALAPPFAGRFDNSYARLPGAFYTALAPTPLPDPYLVAASGPAAGLLGMDVAALHSQTVIEIFAGNRGIAGASPLAAVYSGHQFGVWAGQLGDGRAILLGEVHHAGARWEVQLKGAGKTPYSRMGDGRAVLRSSIREFLCSEAMFALGVPTTRALCVVGSDYPVIRESIETAAVATRLAPSFLRFGSFEHWYYRERIDELRRLADYALAEFFPGLSAAGNVYAQLLAEVTRRTAELVAHWQAIGFCHGVLNTDNMSLLGLTLDYGPFGFMESFDPRYICNHSDDAGRYAYQMQPRIAHWNLFALAQALLPLIGSMDLAKEALAPFQVTFETALAARMRAKLGLVEHQAGDDALIGRLFELLGANAPDFTIFFRRLAWLSSIDADSDEAVRDLFVDRAGFDAWAEQYRARLRAENSDDAIRRLAMCAVNPKYILRNYLAEVGIRQAQQHDFSEVERLLGVLQRPFDEQPEHEAYAALPPDWATHLELSCSS